MVRGDRAAAGEVSAAYRPGRGGAADGRRAGASHSIGPRADGRRRAAAAGGGVGVAASPGGVGGAGAPLVAALDPTRRGGVPVGDPGHGEPVRGAPQGHGVAAEPAPAERCCAGGRCAPGRWPPRSPGSGCCGCGRRSRTSRCGSADRGSGKSGELACRILDAPGAVIATSTRTDLVELTAACRARTGPVWVFNPSGLGGLPVHGHLRPARRLRGTPDRRGAGRGPAGRRGSRPVRSSAGIGSSGPRRPAAC